MNGREVEGETRDGGKARVCVPTRRLMHRQLFHAALYEAEDVLTATDTVDLVQVEALGRHALFDRVQKQLLCRGAPSALAYANAGLRPVSIGQEYDLFMVVCQNFWELSYINAIRHWKDHCRLSACWLDEMWVAEITSCPQLLRSLNRFDYVFVGYQGTVQPLSEFLGRQCHLLPPGIDALKFAPHADVGNRPVDVYSIGRRREGVHRALASKAADGALFYIHDTYRKMAEIEFVDHRQHRSMFSNIAKRSKFFLVAPGKMNLPNETLGQIEIGYRYFEGAASGAVMLGQPADCRTFLEMFDWPDAVVEIAEDGSDVLDVVEALKSNPERCNAISRRNIAAALTRHDWIYRWLQIYEVIGLQPSAGMLERARLLTELARGLLQPPRDAVDAPRSTARGDTIVRTDAGRQPDQ